MRVLALIVLGLAGCGGSGGSDGADSGRSAPGRGEILSLACQACHSLEPDAGHLIGPNLAGIFGRPAASAVGFDNYSAALRESGIVWSVAELDQWLADPAGYLPGTTMTFTGYRTAEDRQALLDFLQSATGHN